MHHAWLVVMGALALGACGRIAPGTTGLDRGTMTYNSNGTPASSSAPGGADTTSHCDATTTYSTDSKGNRTVVATSAGCR